MHFHTSAPSDIRPRLTTEPQIDGSLASSVTFTLELVSELSVLGAMWRELENRADVSFFQSWNWIGSWLEEAGIKPWVLVGRASERIVAIGASATFAAASTSRRKDERAAFARTRKPRQGHLDDCIQWISNRSGLWVAACPARYGLRVRCKLLRYSQGETAASTLTNCIYAACRRCTVDTLELPVFARLRF